MESAGIGTGEGRGGGEGEETEREARDPDLEPDLEFGEADEGDGEWRPRSWSGENARFRNSILAWQ